MRRASSIPAALLLLFASGCADGGSSADGGGSGDTGGRRDAGPGGGPCGEVGQMCCSGAARCMPGGVCGTEGQCCVLPGAGRCLSPSDCCNGLDCLGGDCCAVRGQVCRTADECCGDNVCTDGTCQSPTDGCGVERGPCCAGDVCPSGLVCTGGSCVRCGNEGEGCCRPPTECKTGLLCTAGTCTAPAAECGRDGQPCCEEGTGCTGSLVCTAGTCEPPSTSCDATTCGGCVGSASRTCGWCDATDTCAEGDARGPSEGACASGWQFGGSASCDDPDTCPDNRDCEACTRDTSFVCGWCATAGTCRRGTASGPMDGSCADADWAWTASECAAPPEDRCAMNDDCESCTRATGTLCGWCADRGTCHAGAASGPTDGSCAGDDWAWVASECAGPPMDECVDATACGACTARGACGWCADDRRCRPGGIAGPTDGTCAGDDWDYVASECACLMVRDDTCMADADCCDALSCRRGVSFTTPRCCTEAGAACASGGDCCGFMDCVGGSCACRDAGRACLDARDCCSTTCTGGVCG